MGEGYAMDTVIKRAFQGLTTPTVITSPKCQVVIPKSERDKIGLKPGIKVLVEAVGDHIEIRLLPRDPIAEYHGLFKGGPSRPSSTSSGFNKKRS
jgi:AbrB family looped-hinge helix DNA binding protein